MLNYMLDSPKAPSDPLSDLLELVGARPIVSGGFLAGGRWALAFPAAENLKIFVVARGQCVFRQEGSGFTVGLSQGDVVLLTGGGPFVVASDDDATPVPAAPLFQEATGSMITVGSGEDFSYLGGHVALDATFAHLLTDCLATVTISRRESGLADTTEWLMRRIGEEQRVDRPGTILASKALGQLLIIEVLRDGRSEIDSAPAGWLSGYADARLAAAFHAMHDNPTRSWHLEELAQRCGMSRSSFVDRFTRITGIPPLAYLSRWRIGIAQRMLITQTISIGQIADMVGYSSDAALSTAFKRIVGVSPRHYRRSMPHR